MIPNVIDTLGRLTEADRTSTIGSLRKSILAAFYKLQENWDTIPGMSEEEAARAVGVPLGDLHRWEAAWRDSGLDGLGSIETGGGSW